MTDSEQHRLHQLERKVQILTNDQQTTFRALHELLRVMEREATPRARSTAAKLIRTRYRPRGRMSL